MGTERRNIHPDNWGEEHKSCHGLSTGHEYGLPGSPSLWFARASKAITLRHYRRRLARFRIEGFPHQVLLEVARSIGTMRTSASSSMSVPSAAACPGLACVKNV